MNRKQACLRLRIISWSKCPLIFSSLFFQYERQVDILTKRDCREFDIVRYSSRSTWSCETLIIIEHKKSTPDFLNLNLVERRILCFMDSRTPCTLAHLWSIWAGIRYWGTTQRKEVAMSRRRYRKSDCVGANSPCRGCRHLKCRLANAFITLLTNICDNLSYIHVYTWHIDQFTRYVKLCMQFRKCGRLSPGEKEPSPRELNSFSISSWISSWRGMEKLMFVKYIEKSSLILGWST